MAGAVVVAPLALDTSMLTGGVDLLRPLGSIKIKAPSIYIFTKILIRPGLKHDLNKSTPPVGTQVSEQLYKPHQTLFRLGAYTASDNAQH